MTLMMLGAKNLGATKDSLQFQIQGSKKVTHIKIKLDYATDTYIVTFYKCGKFEIESETEHTGIYDDMLHELIQNETGLYTKM